MHAARLVYKVVGRRRRAARQPPGKQQSYGCEKDSRAAVEALARATLRSYLMTRLPRSGRRTLGDAAKREGLAWISTEPDSPNMAIPQRIHPTLKFRSPH